MTFKELINARPYYSDDEPVGGVEEFEAEPVEEPEPELNFEDPRIAAELDRRSQELAKAQMDRWKATQVPQQLPNVQKTPEQIKREKIERITSRTNWEDAIADIVDMVAEAEDSGRKKAIDELRPLITHSIGQSGADVVQSHIQVSAEARPYLESTIRDLGLNPKDLNNPANAALVADAAEMRALRANKPAPPTKAQQLLSNNPTRKAVPTPAPAAQATPKNWRSDLDEDETKLLETLTTKFVPAGMKAEEVFDEQWLKDAINASREMKKYEDTWIK